MSGIAGMKSRALGTSGHQNPGGRKHIPTLITYLITLAPVGRSQHTQSQDTYLPWEGERCRDRQVVKIIKTIKTKKIKIKGERERKNRRKAGPPADSRREMLQIRSSAALRGSRVSVDCMVLIFALQLHP